MAIEPNSRRRGLPLALAVLVASTGALVALIIHTNQPPRILSIDPQIVEAGDEIVVSGSYFGEQPGRVELAGKTIPAESYSEWSPTEIRLTLPGEVGSGLLRLTSGGKTSRGVFIAERRQLPAVAEPDLVPGRPHIDAVEPSQPKIGDIVTIHGRNFGREQVDSAVYFTWAGESEIGRIEVLRDRGAYPSWTEREIKVVVPDGAAPGPVVVHTSEGLSNEVPVDVVATVGTKSYHDSANYAVHYGIRIYAEPFSVPASRTGREEGDSPPQALEESQPAEAPVDPDSRSNDSDREPPPGPVADDAAGDGSSNETDVKLATAPGDVPEPVRARNVVHLWLPEVYPLPEQRNRQVLSADPTPKARPTPGFWLYKVDDLQPGTDRTIEQSLMVERYAVRTEIVPGRVPWDYDSASYVFRHYTRTTDTIPADSEEIVSVTGRTVGRERNPYSRARYIYNFVTSSITHEAAGAADALGILDSGSGNSFGVAALYVAMARAAAVPARLVGGYRIDAERELHPHHWAEFYIAAFGWVPVDPVLGSTDQRDYYFGNLDNRRITMTVDEHRLPTLRQHSTVHRDFKRSFWRYSQAETAGELDEYHSETIPALLLGVY